MPNRKQDYNEDELELPFVDPEVLGARAAELEEDDDSLPVLNAAKRNDAPLLSLLLALGENPNEADDTGWAALHEAAFHGYDPLVQALLRAGVNVEAKTEQGDTALSVAAMEDEVGVIELLVRAGAKLDAENDVHLTPLILATLNGSSNAVRALLEHGANYKILDREGGTLLHQAAQQDDPEVIALYLAAGIGIDAPDKRHRTPLHWAAAGFCQEAAEVLLAQGADLSVRDENGNTVLHAICGAYIHDLMTISGTDGQHLIPRSLEEDDLGRYHLSRHDANEKKFERFKQRFDPQQESKKSWLEERFSYRARQAARFTLAMLLERGGIEIDARNNEGETALVVAETAGFHDLVDLLLARGADPTGGKLGERDLADAYAFTPIDALDALGSALNKKRLCLLNGFLSEDCAMEFESATLAHERPIPYLPTGPEGVVAFFCHLLDEAEQFAKAGGAERNLWAEYVGLQTGRGRNIKKEACLLLAEGEPGGQSELQGQAMLRVEVRESQIFRVVYSLVRDRREQIVRTRLYPA